MEGIKQANGRALGWDLVATKYGEDDYSIWVTEDKSEEHSGGSVRGTLDQIYDDFKGEPLLWYINKLFLKLEGK